MLAIYFKYIAPLVNAGIVLIIGFRIIPFYKLVSSDAIFLAILAVLSFVVFYFRPIVPDKVVLSLIQQLVNLVILYIVSMIVFAIYFFLIVTIYGWY